MKKSPGSDGFPGEILRNIPGKVMPVFQKLCQWTNKQKAGDIFQFIAEGQHILHNKNFQENYDKENHPPVFSYTCINNGWAFSGQTSYIFINKIYFFVDHLKYWRTISL